VVFDQGDRFWETLEHRQALEDGSAFPIHFLRVANSSRIPINEGCRAAYELGAEYIVRVNDDTEFTSEGWLSSAVHTLRSFAPRNLGVVGPTCQQGNNKILTHDMVHRTHLRIFEEYYPSEFDNWWLDDWMSHVYGARHTSKLPNWVVLHNTHTYGTRYVPNLEQKRILTSALLYTKQQIIDFVTMGVCQTREASIFSSERVDLISKHRRYNSGTGLFR